MEKPDDLIEYDQISETTILTDRESSTSSRITYESTDEPLQLISHKLSGDGFVINDEAIEILDCILGPICVVSVSGPKQTGKSGLMNLLLGSPKGFKIANGGTRGI